MEVEKPAPSVRTLSIAIAAVTALAAALVWLLVAPGPICPKRATGARSWDGRAVALDEPNSNLR
jgi:hypothetical protein